MSSIHEWRLENQNSEDSRNAQTRRIHNSVSKMAEEADYDRWIRCEK